MCQSARIGMKKERVAGIGAEGWLVVEKVRGDRRRTAALLLTNLLIVWAFDRFVFHRFPDLGGDSAWFIPRLVDTHHFMLLNGIRIHWWTPSFGGGLPLFANPESMQFSIPQALLFLLPPSRAVQVTYWIVISAGFFGCHALLRSVFDVRFLPALFGASLFSLNGFFMHRMAAGQLSYHAFPLLPLCLFLLLSSRPRGFLAVTGQATAAGVLLAYLVYSGGYYLPYLWALAALMVLALHGTQVGRYFPLRSVLFKSGLAMAIALALAAPKLHAASSFLSSFPRLYFSQQLSEGKTWLWLLGFQFFGAPLERLHSTDIGLVEALLRKTLQMEYDCHLWEYDCSMSLAVLPLLLVALFAILHACLVRSEDGFGDRVVRLSFLCVLCLLVWVLHDLMVVRGPLVQFLEHVPGYEWLSLKLRFSAVLLLPAAVGAALGLNELWSRFRATWIRAALFCALCAAWIPFLADYRCIARSSYYAEQMMLDMSAMDEVWLARKAHPRAIRPIERVVRLPRIGLDTLDLCEHLLWYDGMTVIEPYEPVFGYGLEHFQTDVVPGPVAQVFDGAFNIHYPLAFMGTTYSDRPLFERIGEDDAINFQRFVAHGVPDWALPQEQHALLRVCRATVMVCIALWLALGVKIYRSSRVLHAPLPRGDSVKRRKAF